MSLATYGVVEAVVPNGGWHYEQDLGEGKKMRIPLRSTAGSAEKLVKKVTMFRAERNIPVEDVERDIANFIKEVSPRNDRWSGKKTTDELVPPREKQTKLPLLNRVLEWLTSSGRRRPRLINDPEEIRRRAEICRACKQNVRWQTACAPCNEKVVYKGKMVRQKLHSEFDDLMACRLHDTLNSTLIYLDQDFLPVRHQDAPEMCWLK